MLLFTGCGGGGHKESITDKIKKRDAIIIIHAYPAGVCNSQELKQSLAQGIGAKDIITSVEDNSVSCATYGRDYNTCGEEFYGGYPNACVIGFNVPPGVANIDTDLSLAADTVFSSVQ